MCLSLSPFLFSLPYFLSSSSLLPLVRQVSLEERLYRDCNSDTSSRCELGDLVSRHGTLKVSGTVKDVSDTQRIMTDTNLPLSGPKTIVGHSIVVYDDHAPKHRGDRMACSG